MRKHDPQCIFLIETKSNEVGMKRMAMSLGFKNYTVVEARGTSRGLFSCGVTI